MVSGDSAANAPKIQVKPEFHLKPGKVKSSCTLPPAASALAVAAALSLIY